MKDTGHGVHQTDARRYLHLKVSTILAAVIAGTWSVGFVLVANRPAQFLEPEARSDRMGWSWVMAIVCAGYVFVLLSSVGVWRRRAGSWWSPKHVPLLLAALFVLLLSSRLAFGHGAIRIAAIVSEVVLAGLAATTYFIGKSRAR